MVKIATECSYKWIVVLNCVSLLIGQKVLNFL